MYLWLHPCTVRSNFLHLALIKNNEKNRNSHPISFPKPHMTFHALTTRPSGGLGHPGGVPAAQRSPAACDRPRPPDLPAAPVPARGPSGATHSAPARPSTRAGTLEGEAPSSCTTNADRWTAAVATEVRVKTGEPADASSPWNKKLTPILANELYMLTSKAD